MILYLFEDPKIVSVGINLWMAKSILGFLMTLASFIFGAFCLYDGGRNNRPNDASLGIFLIPVSIGLAILFAWPYSGVVE